MNSTHYFSQENATIASEKKSLIEWIKDFQVDKINFIKKFNYVYV